MDWISSDAVALRGVVGAIALALLGMLGFLTTKGGISAVHGWIHRILDEDHEARNALGWLAQFFANVIDSQRHVTVCRKKRDRSQARVEDATAKLHTLGESIRSAIAIHGTIAPDVVVLQEEEGQVGSELAKHQQSVATDETELAEAKQRAASHVGDLLSVQMLCLDRARIRSRYLTRSRGAFWALLLSVVSGAAVELAGVLQAFAPYFQTVFYVWLVSTGVFAFFASPFFFLVASKGSPQSGDRKYKPIARWTQASNGPPEGVG